MARGVNSTMYIIIISNKNVKKEVKYLLQPIPIIIQPGPAQPFTHRPVNDPLKCELIRRVTRPVEHLYKRCIYANKICTSCNITFALNTNCIKKKLSFVEPSHTTLCQKCSHQATWREHNVKIQKHISYACRKNGLL